MNTKLVSEIVAGLNTQQRRDNPAEMRRRIAILERALRGLLETLTSHGYPQGDTIGAIRKAQEALER